MDALSHILSTGPALESFCYDDLITDVLRPLKSGKEATVCYCRAHPSTSAPLLVAEAHRTLERRSFPHGALYREGRIVPDDGLRHGTTANVQPASVPRPQRRGTVRP